MKLVLIAAAALAAGCASPETLSAKIADAEPCKSFGEQGGKPVFQYDPYGQCLTKSTYRLYRQDNPNWSRTGTMHSSEPAT